LRQRKKIRRKLANPPSPGMPLKVHKHRGKLPQKSWGEGDSYSEHGVLASNESPRAEPQHGPGPEPLVRRPGGKSLLKLKVFCFSKVQMRHKFVHFWYTANCSSILLKSFYWSLHGGKVGERVRSLKVLKSGVGPNLAA